MREDIEFSADGVTLRGWFYGPDGADGEVPCVVMAHGFSAIKEMHLDDYAEVFSDAGIACVVYDNRGFGASDAAPGKPRQEIDPWEQVRDYQHAITYAQMRPEVDAGRIGVWGSSYSGAHAYVVGAIDRRVKAVCGQVPLISGRRAFEMLVRIDSWAPTWELLAADRLARARGEEPARMPVGYEGPPARRPPRRRARGGAGDDAGRRRGPDRPVGAADRRLVRVLHRVRGLLVAQRGDAAHARALPGLRAGRVHQAHLPHAAAHGRRAERPARRGRGRVRGVRDRGAPEEARARSGRPLRRVRRTRLRDQLRRGARLVRRAPRHGGTGGVGGRSGAGVGARAVDSAVAGDLAGGGPLAARQDGGR